MPYEFLDHTADVAFRARAADLAGLFRECGTALLNAMVERPETVAAREKRTVEVSAADLELLLVRFLEEILFHKDSESLLLRPAEVEIRRDAQGWVCRARLEGEPIDPARHPLAADVKGVTFHGLEVGRDGEGWAARVTVDV